MHDPLMRERYAAIIARHGLQEVTSEGSVGVVSMPDGHPVNTFGAEFAQVQVDPDSAWCA